MQLRDKSKKSIEALPEPQAVEVYLQCIFFPVHSKREVNFDLKLGRKAWLQVLQGSLRLEDRAAESGEGIALRDIGNLAIDAIDDAEILLFEHA